MSSVHRKYAIREEKLQEKIDLEKSIEKHWKLFKTAKVDSVRSIYLNKFLAILRKIDLYSKDLIYYLNESKKR